mmetsp:Transcript_8023/g.21452  ORF Transcript_8023/g.21452 Transcript_8023/m.21452 type:complete len:223 (-) Transcript_8023:1442-2110(-)
MIRPLIRILIRAQHGMTAILEIVEATTTRISLRASDVARAAVVWLGIVSRFPARRQSIGASTAPTRAPWRPSATASAMPRTTSARAGTAVIVAKRRASTATRTRVAPTTAKTPMRPRCRTRTTPTPHGTSKRSARPRRGPRATRAPASRSSSTTTASTTRTRTWRSSTWPTRVTGMPRAQKPMAPTPASLTITGQSARRWRPATRTRLAGSVPRRAPASRRA